MINYFFRDPTEQSKTKNNLLSHYIEKYAIKFHDEHLDYQRAREKLKGMIHFGRERLSLWGDLRRLIHRHKSLFFNVLPTVCFVEAT